jgi:FkbM family methyltransferase
VQRGTYRLALWLYQHCNVPDVEVEAQLEHSLWISLRLRTWVDYNIYCLGLYEEPLARFFTGAIKPDSTVLDIGAYIGQYTLLAAKHAPLGRAIAFEPHPESHRRLLDNVTRNHLSNVTVLSQAVGSTPGRMPFDLQEQQYSSKLIPSSQVGDALAEFEVTTVDETVRKLGLPCVDLIKIDVEGAEGQVLSGAQATLSAFHPLLIVEIDRSGEQVFGDDSENTLASLQGLGYQLHRVRRRVSPLTDLCVEYDNVVAIPFTRPRDEAPR